MLDAGEYVEGVAIVLTLLLNATIATYTEQSAGNALAALAKIAQPLTTVIRDQRIQQVSLIRDQRMTPRLFTVPNSTPLTLRRSQALE